MALPNSIFSATYVFFSGVVHDAEALRRPQLPFGWKGTEGGHCILVCLTARYTLVFSCFGPTTARALVICRLRAGRVYVPVLYLFVFLFFSHTVPVRTSCRLCPVCVSRYRKKTRPTVVDLLVCVRFWPALLPTTSTCW